MLSPTQIERVHALSDEQFTVLQMDLRARYRTIPLFQERQELITLLHRLRLDHVALTMPLFREQTPNGISALEALVGKPITRIQKITRHSNPQRLSRPPKPRANDPRVITVQVQNPKKPGSASYDRFALYKDGMTVSEALAAGVTSGDVKWDSERGFICLS